jgi:bifunctional oligoribonuclease and PAP phosphatase NrnA
MSDPSLVDIAERLKRGRQVAVLTHQRPDPDALGSASAAALLINKAVPGAEVSVVLFEPPPGPYAFLVEASAGLNVVTYSAAWAAGAGAACDTVFVVDTCTYAQLEPAKEFLLAAKERIVAVDHHASRDAIGTMLHTDTTAAAAVELITELGEALGVALDSTIATRLYSGLVGDTGWFRFDSVTPRTHRIAAKLIAAGAQPAALYERLMQTETRPKLALMTRALERLHWASNDRIALMALTIRDFSETQALMSQTEYLVDMPMQIGTTEVAGLLTELADGRFRLSLRSKHDVDVNLVCRSMGGGGHAKAAGARVEGPLEKARQTVLAAIEAGMKV